MPIHVKIDINGHPVSELHIGRIEGDTNPDSINKYRAVSGTRPLTVEDWYSNGGVEFEHRYGDMVDVCVMKALQALNGDK